MRLSPAPVLKLAVASPAITIAQHYERRHEWPKLRELGQIPNIVAFWNLGAGQRSTSDIGLRIKLHHELGAVYWLIVEASAAVSLAPRTHNIPFALIHAIPRTILPDGFLDNWSEHATD